MRNALAMLAVIALVLVLALMIWAHELARPHMNIRRQLAAEDDEGDN